MDSMCSSTDLPEMARSASKPRTLPRVEVLVATSAGKPVFHFMHGQTPCAHATGEGGMVVERDPLHVLSLCATMAGFAAVAPHVQTVTTRSGVVFFSSSSSLQVAVSAADRTFPVPLLTGLARLAVSFILFALSIRIVDALVARPHLDVTSVMAPLREQLTRLMSYALAHPLPYATALAPSLPCPTTPTSRNAVTELLRSAVVRSNPAVTHAMILTASPPFPRKLISTASPSGAPLSTMDKLILASLLSDDCRLSNSICPTRVYLQSSGYERPFVVATSSTSLRLHADDYKLFETAVGGSSWRPEWGSCGGDIVWIIVIAAFSSSSESSDALCFAKACAKTIEESLWGSRAVRDLVVAMERPWVVSDIPSLMQQGIHTRIFVIAVMSDDRIVATLGATDHSHEILLLKALRASSWLRHSSRSFRVSATRKRDHLSAETKPNDVMIVDSTRKIWKYAENEQHQVYGQERNVLVAFDGKFAENHARCVFTNLILPWVRRFRRSLLSEFDRADVPPRTMFRNLLSPFSS